MWFHDTMLIKPAHESIREPRNHPSFIDRMALRVLVAKIGCNLAECRSPVAGIVERLKNNVPDARMATPLRREILCRL